MMKKSEINIKQVKIPLLYEFNDELPIVVFRAVFRVAGEIVSSKNGLAKIVANMLNEGSKTLGVNEFAKKLEIKAIDMFASSAYETFIIEISCLKEHFLYATSLLKELLNDLNFTDQTLDKIKNQTISEILTSQSNFDYLAQVKLNEILYPNSNLANPTVGSLESIEDINLQDVEEFYKTNLNLQNLFLVLAGDIKEDEVDFNELFFTLEAGEKREITEIKTSDKKEVLVTKEQSEQAYIYFGAPYDVQSDERFKATVAMFILGSSGFGSRLMEEIRVKKGLAYSIYARSSFNLSNCSFLGYMQTKNENKEEALKSIKDEIDRFLEFGANQDELTQAKKFLLGNEPLQKERFAQRVAIAQNEFYYGYEFGQFDKNLKKIADLTLDELNIFIKTHKEISNLSFSIVEK